MFVLTPFVPDVARSCSIARDPTCHRAPAIPVRAWINLSSVGQPLRSTVALERLTSSGLARATARLSLRLAELKVPYGWLPVLLCWEGAALTFSYNTRQIG